MENDHLKIQLDSIQRILSYCITQTYNVLIGNILRKKGCINNIQFKEILQKEYIRITDELSSIYLNYPALACVEEYYNDDDFLWESSFFESLTKEQKQKYTSFSVSSFEYAKYIKDTPYIMMPCRCSRTLSMRFYMSDTQNISWQK